MHVFAACVLETRPALPQGDGQSPGIQYVRLPNVHLLMLSNCYCKCCFTSCQFYLFQNEQYRIYMKELTVVVIMFYVQSQESMYTIAWRDELKTTKSFSMTVNIIKLGILFSEPTWHVIKHFLYKVKLHKFLALTKIHIFGLDQISWMCCYFHLTTSP